MCDYKTFLIVGIAYAASTFTAMAQDVDAADLNAMRSAAKSYADAWLTNDADTVMARFVDEPVLSPSGLPYVEGREAARAFWFSPMSPPTRVTDFELFESESSASGNLGYVRGTFRLVFEYDGESFENQGKYVTILRKGADGTWRISHHIWDDLPQAD